MPYFSPWQLGESFGGGGGKWRGNHGILEACGPTQRKETLLHPNFFFKVLQENFQMELLVFSEKKLDFLAINFIFPTDNIFWPTLPSLRFSLGVRTQIRTAENACSHSEQQWDNCFFKSLPSSDTELLLFPT